jgi:hypothetical protein
MEPIRLVSYCNCNEYPEDAIVPWHQGRYELTVEGGQPFGHLFDLIGCTSLYTASNSSLLLSGSSGMFFEQDVIDQRRHARILNVSLESPSSRDAVCVHTADRKDHAAKPECVTIAT